MENKFARFLFLVVFLPMLLIPDLAFADLQSSIGNIKSELTVVILPFLAFGGLGIAGISFFSGNPQSKQHLFYAICGCIISFGAQALVNFISSMIR